MEDPAGQNTENNAGSASAGLQIFWEILIFLAGIFIGFFWYFFTQHSPNNAEAHIIIGLLVIIICMARYLYLLWQRQK